MPGLDRRTIQKRLERLRRVASGDGNVTDDEVVAYARTRLTEMGGPASRGLAKLQSLASPTAKAFAQQAGLQGPVIGDWVELAHSPGDRGWSRSRIRVERMARGTLFARGRSQGWLAEKKAYLKECWPTANDDPNLLRNLVPNQLKLGLLQFRALGTEDSPLCAVRVAEVDWQTCFALNARLDAAALMGGTGETVRERWGEPVRVVERRGLPGMLVAHIVVKTVDNRLLVCRRQAVGMEDEAGAWSLSIEERWRGRPFKRGGPGVGDSHPHDLVRRAVAEELGIEVEDDEIRVLSWGIEASVLYPGFIAIASMPVGSWEVEGLHGQAPDANELRFVTTIPAEIGTVAMIAQDGFAPPDHPELTGRWHRTAKARLVGTLAHLEALAGRDGRARVLAQLGR